MPQTVKRTGPDSNGAHAPPESAMTVHVYVPTARFVVSVVAVVENVDVTPACTTWTTYAVAFGTELQVKVTGAGMIAPAAGAICVGAFGGHAKPTFTDADA